MSNFQLEVDLVPYDVEVNSNKSSIIIKECFGSILGKLYKESEAERKTAFVTSASDKAVLLDFDFIDSSDISITFSPNQTKNKKINLITEWISDNFHAIDEIGYEVLGKKEGVIKSIKGIGLEIEEPKKKQNKITP